MWYCELWMRKKLHICHLGKFYPPAPGGIETHVQTLARAQAQLGADVHVLCVNHANRAGKDVTWSRYGSTDTVREYDGKVRVTRLGRAATVARLDVCPELLHALDDLFENPVDVLHLHSPNPTMLLAITRLRKIAPIVITHHSDIVKQKVLRHVFNPFEKLVYSRASKLLVTSEAYVGGSPLLTRFRRKTVVLPMGLDLSPFLNPAPAALTAAAEMRETLPGPIWLAVGRCVYYKGLDTAIAALARVPGTLVIIGSGPMEHQLRQQAQSLGVADRIVWRGYATPEELHGAYLAATALWFPSSHRSEAYGLVQVEAMAAGCPVLNTSIPYSGVAWVSPHEESGLTVRVGDVIGFAAAAQRLVDEPVLRDRLSAGARQRAISEFDDKLMAKRTLDLYASLRPTRAVRAEMTLKQWVHQFRSDQPWPTS